MLKHDILHKGSSSALLFFLLIFWESTSAAASSRISHADLDIQIGQAIFEKLWVFAPSSTKSSDGLGPLYNARSCAQCHNPPRLEPDKLPVSLVIMLSIEAEDTDLISDGYQRELMHNGFVSEPVYGKQIQTFAYPGALAEAVIKPVRHHSSISFPDKQDVKISYTEYQLEAPAYGPFHRSLRRSARIAPRLQGLGILERIPDEQILALEDPDDLDGDGISGRANRVFDLLKNAQGIGRFGWKASKASLEQQNLAALAHDIGVSSWLFPKPEGDCSAAQKACLSLAENSLTSVQTSGSALATSTTETLEASKEITDLLNAFTREMGSAAIRANDLTQQKHSPGKETFKKIGCLACHTDQYTPDYNEKTSAGFTPPYSDLLLHDMGDGLADNRREFLANGREWRTAPLWGIAHYLKQSNAPMFLHDGRAGSALEAILWHSGEAETSKQRFMALSEAQRQQLIHFVESL